MIQIKCKCDNIGSKECIDNYCKKCCYNIKCKRHPNKNRNKKISCKCTNLYINYNCLDKLCSLCCNNQNCKIHNKLCNCKNKNYELNCLDKLCNNCCKNKKCPQHFTICKCNNDGDENCINKFCQNCCKNFECDHHYMYKEDLTIEVLNDYKKIITNYKIKIPVEIINYIVDEFIDDRNNCCVCQIRFDYDNLTTCNECKQYICYDCVFDKDIKCSNYDCYHCRSGRGCWNNRSERYCEDCKESCSVSSNEIEDFDYYDMLETIREEEDKKEKKLLKAIKKAGLEFRNDSTLYKDYINGTSTYSLQIIIIKMVEMKWFFENTKYKQFMDENFNDDDFIVYKEDTYTYSEIAKKKAIKNWIINCDDKKIFPPESLIKKNKSFDFIKNNKFNYKLIVEYYNKYIYYTKTYEFIISSNSKSEAKKLLLERNINDKQIILLQIKSVIRKYEKNNCLGPIEFTIQYIDILSSNKIKKNNENNKIYLSKNYIEKNLENILINFKKNISDYLKKNINLL